MSILTDKDYAEWRESYSKYGMMNEAMAMAAFKAAEAAVIRKLATVSVEWPESASSSHEVYLREQIEPMLAAARAQALEEAAKRIEGPNNNYGAVIRALIGCKDD